MRAPSSTMVGFRGFVMDLVARMWLVVIFEKSTKILIERRTSAAEREIAREAKEQPCSVARIMKTRTDRGNLLTDGEIITVGAKTSPCAEVSFPRGPSSCQTARSSLLPSNAFVTRKLCSSQASRAAWTSAVSCTPCRRRNINTVGARRFRCVEVSFQPDSLANM